MKMGPGIQKGMLVAAAVFAGAMSVYALVISVMAYQATGMPHTLLAWCLMSAVGVSVMVRLYRHAWRMIEFFDRD